MKTILLTAALWWMPAWTHHPSHHRPAFKSHYCQTTSSPYYGVPPSTVCCQWHSYYAKIPDGVGYWDCTIGSPPLVPARKHV